MQVKKNKLEFMSHDFYKQFAENNITDVTILACKLEGYLKDTEVYSLSITATLKELPSILIEIDNWNEDELIHEIDLSYQCIRKYMLETSGIVMPTNLNYKIEYLEVREWMNLFDYGHFR